MVYRSPEVPDPLAARGVVALDIGYRGMVVTREHGRSVLYVGGLTAGEFIPSLRGARPPRLLRTTDGRRFLPVKGAPGVIHTRSGPVRAVGFRAMQVVGGRLYVTATGGLTGDGVVMRVDRAAGRRARFTQVTTPQSRLRAAALRRAAVRGHGRPPAGLRRLAGRPAARTGTWRLVVGRAPGAGPRSRRSSRWPRSAAGCTSGPAAGCSPCSRPPS